MSVKNLELAAKVKYIGFILDNWTEQQNNLKKVERLACVATIGTLRTTPTAAMEVLIGLLPLTVGIKREALLSASKGHTERKE